MDSGRGKIILSMIIWGSVGIFARFSKMDGISLAFVRVFLGSLIFAFIYTLKSPMWIKNAYLSIKPRIKLVFLLGLSLGLNWILFFSAVLYTDIPKATLIYYLAPIIVVLLSIVFLKEPITLKKSALVFTAFLGALIIAGQEEISFSNRDFLGVLFALGGAFFYACVTILGRYLRDVESSALTFFQLLFATIVLLPVVLGRGLTFSSSSFYAASVIALVHTVFALLIYMQGLKSVKANEAALLSYLDPLSAIVYASLIFGEIPSLMTIIGGGLILLASLLDILLQRQ
ncbi:hypothetical protein PAP_05695 [Palaeococcus pacificus DY20341]|uniref:EamA domain-containing protein n=1 Tax=Palaeococcus pacificus DY20341 TaxID=1343739 RepID=A0A075LTA4_9EURY|nr:DMT family transporter [Palaeococcus pacificus]AIF69539.1 hypothetical protein PAP_05695 [Palaeococcus pacificus DY20341]